MARKPLIAGNWKMNLNHLEAIALVQKIAFSLPAKYFEKVDVTVLPPFTDIRTVQTLVEGDKLLLTYGARTSPPTSRVRTPARSAARCWPSWAARSWSSATPSGARCTASPTRRSSPRQGRAAIRDHPDRLRR